MINNAESKVWPPWPWPPWEGDDDDDHPKRPGGGEPSERAKHARKLAKKVFRFEKSLAEAGLDLYECFTKSHYPGSESLFFLGMC